jgi:Holliday junction DNA helicase RuvA
VAGGAVGLEIQLSERSSARLPAPGETVRLWTHLVVREDAWTLYGFVDPPERAMFRLLTTVSGIGPRVALGMLSAVEPAEIARCLRTADERGLARLPGIGKKSAARLVVELGQRIPAALCDGNAAAPPQACGQGGEVFDQSLMALQAMGLPAAQAEGLLRQAGQADPALHQDAAAWVRAALGHLGVPGR